jgi:hypothetical protein
MDKKNQKENNQNNYNPNNLSSFFMHFGFENSLPLYVSTVNRIDKRTKKYGKQRIKINKK